MRSATRSDARGGGSFGPARGIRIADAGGLTAFAETEACALTSTTDRGPDGTCPTFCVRCGCCATPILHSVLDVVATFIPPVVALPQAATTGLPSARSEATPS